MAVTLIFSQPGGIRKSPVALVFGDDSPPASNEVDLTIEATLPALEATLEAELLAVSPLEIETELTLNMQPLLLADVDNSVYRPVASFCRFAFQRKAKPLSVDNVFSWNLNAPLRGDVQLCWEETAQIHTDKVFLWNDLRKARQDMQLRWEETAQIGRDYALLWDNLETVRSDWVLSWEDATPIAASTRLPWINLDRLRGDRVIPWGQADRLSQEIVLPNGSGKKISRDNVLPWHQGKRPAWGRTPLPPVPPPPNPPYNYGQATLIFACPVTNRHSPIIMIFGKKPCAEWGGDGSTIPERPWYIIVNDIDIFRTDDGTKILAESVDISASIDAWSWDFKLTVPASEYEKLADRPEIEINLNQLKFRCWVDPIHATQRPSSESFSGRRQIQITGRSLTSVLDIERRSGLFTEGATAQQIAWHAVQQSGFDSPFFEMDWFIEDWLIPGNTYSFENKSAIGVINDMVNPVNGLLISHPHRRKLMVYPRYAHAPWDKTKDPLFSYPVSLALNRSTSLEDNAACNGIIVAGTDHIARGFRSGTDGAPQKTMVVEPLLTTLEAVRARAEAELYQTGRRDIVSFETPLHHAIPQLLPGDFIALEGEQGFIRSVGLTASWQSGLKIRKKISMERVRDSW